MEWLPATEQERDLLHRTFQRSARHRGKLPDAVHVVHSQSGITHSAMKYIEPGKWDRWGIQLHPPKDICESWSEIMRWIRPLVGDKTAIEVYPREVETMNTAPIRWFWVVPFDQVPPEFNLLESR